MFVGTNESNTFLGVSEISVSRYEGLNCIGCSVLSLLNAVDDISTLKISGPDKDSIILSSQDGLQLWKRNQDNESVWELGRERDFEAQITSLALGSDAKHVYLGLQNGTLYRCQIDDFNCVKGESRPPSSVKTSSTESAVEPTPSPINNFDDLFDFDDNVATDVVLKDQQPPLLSRPSNKPDQFPVIQILLSPNDLDATCVHDLGKRRRYIGTRHFLNQPEYQCMCNCGF